MPVIALGESVGLIHLEWSERLDAVESPPDPVLIRNVAEQVGLAIGNVRLREELRRQAIRDPLTGLYNRRHFDETLKSRIAEYDRSGRRFALLMIDIDHFKRINDEHGHDIGDEVLRETAALLARTVRSDETAFRLGGEEFVMLVDDGEGTGESPEGASMEETDPSEGESQPGEEQSSETEDGEIAPPTADLHQRLSSCDAVIVRASAPSQYQRNTPSVPHSSPTV